MRHRQSRRRHAHRPSGRVLNKMAKTARAAELYVPGAQTCPDCQCWLMTSTLHAKTGRVSARDETQVCPNGCGTMRKVTWKEYAESSEEALLQKGKTINKLTDALCFYADEDTYVCTRIAMRHVNPPSIIYDRGERARRALDPDAIKSEELNDPV